MYSPPAVYATTESYSRTSSTQSSDSDQSLLPAAGAKSGVQVSAAVGGVAVSLQSSSTSYARSVVSAVFGFKPANQRLSTLLVLAAGTTCWNYMWC